MNAANWIKGVRASGAQTPIERYVSDFYSTPMVAVVSVGVVGLLGLAGYMIHLTLLGG